MTPHIPARTSKLTIQGQIAGGVGCHDTVDVYTSPEEEKGPLRFPPQTIWRQKEEQDRCVTSLFFRPPASLFMLLCVCLAAPLSCYRCSAFPSVLYRCISVGLRSSSCRPYCLSLLIVDLSCITSVSLASLCLLLRCVQSYDV